MNNETKITRLDRLATKLKVKVAVYCRISTAHPGQVESLTNQIEHYKKMIKLHLDWDLVDVFFEVENIYIQKILKALEIKDFLLYQNLSSYLVEASGNIKHT